MTTQNLRKKHSIKTGIFCGFVSMTAIWISSVFTLDGSTKYTGNLLTTALTFGILICGIVLCYKMIDKFGHVDNPPGQLILAGIFFSLTAGFIGGLIHYLNSTFIDPDYAKKALTASEAKWAANNYSEEAIAGQIELTDTFQSSWEWAFTSGIFMVIISLFLFLAIGCFKNLINNKEKRIEVV